MMRSRWVALGASFLVGASIGALACTGATFTCEEDAHCDREPGGRCGADGRCVYGCAEGATGSGGGSECGGATSTSGTDATSGGTSSSGTGSGSSGAPLPGCGDGVLEPGNVCFGAIQTLQYGGRGLAVGDLDDDDDLDILVPLGRLFVCFNDGGVFAPPMELPITGLSMMADNGDVSSAAVGPVDGDLAPDIVARGGLTSFLRSKSTGDGAFELRANHPLCPRYEVRSVAIDDLDGDGTREVLVHYQECSSPPVGVGIYNLGDDGVTFKPSPLGSIASLHDDAYVAVADLDADGHKDVITGSAYFLRQGGAWVESSLPSAGAVDHLAVALLDEDAYPDVVTIALNKVTIARHLDGMPGVFGGPEPLGLFGTFHAVAAGDLDNDGLQDLVLGESSGGRNTLVTLRNAGYPGVDFEAREIDLGPGNKVVDVVLAHLNDDYALDVAVSVNPPVGQTLVLFADP